MNYLLAELTRYQLGTYNFLFKIEFILEYPTLIVSPAIMKKVFENYRREYQIESDSFLT